MSKIFPTLDKSVFVTSPYTAIIAKIAAVVKKIVTIEAVVYTMKIMESVTPVK